MRNKSSPPLISICVSFIHICVIILLGIKIVVEAAVNLQLSARSIGLFEAFYSSLKPIQLMQMEIEIASSGKLPNGTTELPFEFPLKPLPGEDLFDTYHGVYVNVQYFINAHVTRSNNDNTYIYIGFNCVDNITSLVYLWSSMI